MDKETIKKLIEERFPGQYPEWHLEKVIVDVEGFIPSIRSEFEYFLKTGKMPENPVEIEGYSADKLIKERRLYPVGAYLMLGWLTRDPEKAKESLLRGHDRVITRDEK